MLSVNFFLLLFFTTTHLNNVVSCLTMPHPSVRPPARPSNTTHRRTTDRPIKREVGGKIRTTKVGRSVAVSSLPKDRATTDLLRIPSGNRGGGEGESVRHHPAKQLLAIIIITENGGGEVGESAPSSPPSCDTNTLSSVSSYYTRFIFVDILPRPLTEQSPNKPTESFGQQRRHHRMLSGVSSPHSVSFRGRPMKKNKWSM